MLLILTIEPLLLAINALTKSLLIPTETRILRWFGYIDSQATQDMSFVGNSFVAKLAGKVWFLSCIKNDEVFCNDTWLVKFQKTALGF